jgi:hypothetical protein
MSLRFAAPSLAPLARLTPDAVEAAMRGCANDNASEQPSDALLHAALRHFAAHGLAAAQHARQQAEAAHAAGDRATYEWWVEICRALDRRLARQLTDRGPIPA